jgi:hypothetical protein
MSLRNLIVVAAALILGAVVAVAGLRAQDRVAPGPGSNGIVLAGPDVGFRVIGLKGKTPIGRLVVRVKGEWMDAELSGGSVVPLK